GDWVERQILEATPDGYRLRAGADVPLPDDIHHLLLRRIELLTEQSVDPETPAGPALLSLELAAAQGQEIDRKEWKAVCRYRGFEASHDVVETLVVNRLARLTPRGWSFFHGALREGLERLAKESGRWADHHRTCAYVLLELYPAERPGIARRLAWHWLQAEDLEAALSPLLQAAEEFRHNYRFDHAIALLEQREEAMRRLCLAEDDPRWAEGWVPRSIVMANMEEKERATELLDRAERSARHYDWPGVLAECAYGRAVMAKRAGAFDECERWVGDALVHYEAVSDRLGIAKSHHVLGSLGHWTGHFEEGQMHFEKANALFEELHDIRGMALCAQGMAGIANRVGDFDGAERFIQRAIGGFEACGDRAGIMNCLNSLGELHRHRGDLARAERYYERVVRVIERGDMGGTHLVAYFNLGLVLLMKKDFEGAHSILSKLLDRLLVSHREGMLAMAHAHLAPCCAAADAWEDFDHHLSQAGEYIKAQGIVHKDIAVVIEMAADIAGDAGETARVEAAYALALDQWKRLGELERASELERRKREKEKRPQLLGNVE
ncbi:MAG: tetratricopeptide repeat protein, partial [Bradymonadaceae bacterium]